MAGLFDCFLSEEMCGLKVRRGGAWSSCLRSSGSALPSSSAEVNSTSSRLTSSLLLVELRRLIGAIYFFVCEGCFALVTLLDDFVRLDDAKDNVACFRV